MVCEQDGHAGQEDLDLTVLDLRLLDEALLDPVELYASAGRGGGQVIVAQPQSGGGCHA